MNGYKKFVPKKLRFQILKALSFVPDKQMVQIQYRIKTGRKLDLKNPKRYTEKIQWYKLYYRNEKMPMCVDKYRVREYIHSKNLDEILVQLYAVYDRPEEINIETLPDKFILKTSDGSGTNIICRDKSQLSNDKIRAQVNSFIKQSSASAGREWAYSHGNGKIIVEQLLEDPSTSDGSINDYKFLCFNGKPEYIVLDIDRFTNHRRNMYDTAWNDLHVASDCPCSDEDFQPPENLPDMLMVAETLSKDFPAVRVDLYSIQGKIYFGELTFFPWSGYVLYDPDSFDFKMGEKFILPEVVRGGGIRSM